MAKRGRGNHQKRIAKPKSIPITDKKAKVWITRAAPGPHPKRGAMSLSVLLKDVLKVAKTSREARSILVNRLVLVDGKVRTEEKFPVGLMDVVSFPKTDKHFRLVVDWKGRLNPVEISKEQAGTKLVRVVRKHICPGTKINLTFHDGRNMLGDNHIHPGDTLVVGLPGCKMSNHLKLEPGARCLIMEGKHAGAIVKLEQLIPRMAGKPAEVKVSKDKGEFVTVAKYLFVVDDAFGVSKE